MRCRTWKFATLLGLGVVAGSGGVGVGQDAFPDVGKAAIERPVKRLVADARAPQAPPKPEQPDRDVAKRIMERPTERLVRNAVGAATANSDKVAPGKVDWHADFETAKTAAVDSGKPVLLFQLLGKLDEEFT